MNSIGVTPYVNYLYTDLRNGIVLLDVNISFFRNSYSLNQNTKRVQSRYKIASKLKKTGLKQKFTKTKEKTTKSYIIINYLRSDDHARRHLSLCV